MTSLAPCFGQETDQSRPDPLPISTPSQPAIEIQCLCPFCGSFNSGIGKPCLHCEMEDTTAARDASRQKSGLWHVMANDTPTAGMSFDALVIMINRQLVIPRSVVRGPTTGQLWRLASKIRGLSREFGHCYACGGDIETSETVCPHCDRVQTVPDHTEHNAQPAPAVSPAVAERQALLLEPKITVHSLNDPVEVKPDPIAAARPVVAERSEHRIPKDDLLTPRDLAKAFQLEFGMPSQVDRYLQPSGQTVRKVKMVLTSVAALGVAFALVWPLINVVPQWLNANAAKASLTSPAASKNTPTLVADARLASDLAFSSPEITPPVQPISPAPVVAAAIVSTPSVIAEPTPVASAEDDPTLLWNNGINAESSHNYVAAVAAYERIESLPSTMWPAQLETRLTLARKELKGEVH